MANNSFKRPALGQSAVLGTLYSTRNDTFLPVSFLRASPPESVVTRTEINTSDMKFSGDDEYKDKFYHMDLNAELSASFLAGMVDVQGSGRYLTEERDGQLTVQESMYYTMTTVHEKLNFMSSETRDLLDLDKLGSGIATHVVTEITWGAKSIVAAKHLLSNDEDRTYIETGLKRAFRKFGKTSVDLDSMGHGRHDSLNHSFKVTVYGDTVVDGKTAPNDFDGAYSFITNVPKSIETLNDGRGVPLVYTLLPIGVFSLFFSVDVPPEDTVRQPSGECHGKFVRLFDELGKAQQSLNHYHSNLARHSFCVPKEHISIVADRIHGTTIAESDLKSQYTQCVKAIRAGKVDSQQLWDIHEHFLRGDSAPANLVAVTHGFKGKLKFVDMITSKGGEYVGYNGHSDEHSLLEKQWGDAYVFYFNEEVRIDNEIWNGNVRLLLDILEDRRMKRLVLIVDCDATGRKLSKPYVSHFYDQEVVTRDLLEQKKLMADKCIMRYGEIGLDPSITTAPSQRRLVRIPCPRPECDSQIRCDWVCFKCLAPVEYGKVDSFLYCDCGRSHYSNYEFKCQSEFHGSEFQRYPKSKLSRLLEAMERPRELNILILGETGVGKSTFINAFVNYLTFQSLEDGLSAKKLNCIIPCSFSTQYVSHGGKLVQEEVKIGYDDDESDGAKGQSATQKTTVYPLYIGHNLVRLIDTPGIGDTRGTEQDRKNMVDVLSVLRNYEELHGILILLRPNNARLTVMFRFCIKELLTHLHRNAARNMVFGFTNTRGSNYQPGDTFRPLESLLSEYKDVIPGLFRQTVYCFDSESFRYLAAQKKGIDMGNFEDYQRSWDHSATEARRLIDYFRTLNPHQVKSTLSLNETRYLVAQLTAPMAEISKTIAKTIAVNEDDAKALSDTRLSGAALQAKLNLQKVTLNARKLNQPKTVCSNKACIKVHAGEGSQQGEIILRKALCHNPCCLKNVPPDSIGTKELIHCAAFNNGRCNRCTHMWTEHLHIMVEYSEESMSLKDPSVEDALKKNGTEIQVRETAIRAKRQLIEQLKSEHRQIQQVAAQFSIYLKDNSITPYNDATLEYLDHLIREERSKVGFGKDPSRLQSLEKDRYQYSEFVKAMTKSIEEGGKSYRPLDAEGVHQMVEKLYTLPHSGKELRTAAAVVGKAYATTFREKPYRVRGRNYWMTAGPSKSGLDHFDAMPIRSPSMIPSSGFSKGKYLSEEMDGPDSSSPPPYESNPNGLRSSVAARVPFDREDRRGSMSRWIKNKFQILSVRGSKR